MATLHPRHTVDDNDDDGDQTCSVRNSILQVFRMAPHVRAAPEYNTMIQS